MKNEEGFTIVELLLILAVILTIGFISYYVINEQRSKPSPNAQDQKAQSTAATTQGVIYKRHFLINSASPYYKDLAVTVDTGDTKQYLECSSVSEEAENSTSSIDIVFNKVDSETCGENENLENIEGAKNRFLYYFVATCPNPDNVTESSSLRINGVEANRFTYSNDGNPASGSAKKSTITLVTAKKGDHCNVAEYHRPEGAIDFTEAFNQSLGSWKF